tara:strand:+ start:375 stop:572 length:198 start_codon:yes stop_codon:yes gene_type:complete
LKILKSNWKITDIIGISRLHKRGKTIEHSSPRPLKSQNAVGIFKQVNKSPYGGRVSGKFLNGMQL